MTATSIEDDLESFDYSNSLSPKGLETDEINVEENFITPTSQSTPLSSKYLQDFMISPNKKIPFGVRLQDNELYIGDTVLKIDKDDLYIKNIKYKSSPVKPEDLADAGFFYTGRSDKTLCFYCGGGLRDWKDNDNPWEEHAVWFARLNQNLQFHPHRHAPPKHPPPQRPGAVHGAPASPGPGPGGRRRSASAPPPPAARHTRAPEGPGPSAQPPPLPDRHGSAPEGPGPSAQPPDRDGSARRPARAPAEGPGPGAAPGPGRERPPRRRPGGPAPAQPRTGTERPAAAARGPGTVYVAPGPGPSAQPRTGTGAPAAKAPRGPGPSAQPRTGTGAPGRGDGLGPRHGICMEEQKRDFSTVGKTTYCKRFSPLLLYT
ncbi:Death-associated inhibitor of apoptosis 1 [Eumeta japonica]|uniref:Death-associated inhibitor of apoptosis 1 n=1 Tax=Eumeta variegata TaxID=151549 RepID=A0A4C1XMA5_EUMVA|nr:Death-associated inhibitor of apoptosis 1 [Eumeta japonica]